MGAHRSPPAQTALSGTTAIKQMPRAANCAPVDSPSPKSRPTFATRACQGGCSTPRGRGAAQNAWPDTFQGARRRKTAPAAAPVNTSTLTNPSSAPRAAAVATKPRRARACARSARKTRPRTTKNARRRATRAPLVAQQQAVAAPPARRADPARTASAAATRPPTPPAESAQADGHSLARIKLPACNARKVGSRKRMAAQPARRADLAHIASTTRPSPPAASAQADGLKAIWTHSHAGRVQPAIRKRRTEPRRAFRACLDSLATPRACASVIFARSGN